MKTLESREELNINDIRKGIFIKRLTNIYLVKDFKEHESKYKGKYSIEYFFRISTKTPNPRLHSNRFDIIDSSEFYYKWIKKPTDQEIAKLKEIIQRECSRFNLETLSYKKTIISTENELTEEKCIDFLKGKGYLVYKPI